MEFKPMKGDTRLAKHEFRKGRDNRVRVGPNDPNIRKAPLRDDGINGGVLEPNETPPIPPDGMRYIGFCQDCRDFVELGLDFSCQKGGHSRDRVRVALLAKDDEPLPHMPALNIGALFMPALWGPVHGQWYMILFYPLWLLLDNLIYGSVHGTGVLWITIVASLLTAAFTIYYALHANAWGYVRAATDKTPDEYIKTERRWTILFVIIAIVFIAFATWYNLMVRPNAG